MSELDVVTLKNEFNGVPAGTQGTIVLEYDGTAFEVEFFDNVDAYGFDKLFNKLNIKKNNV